MPKISSIRSAVSTEHRLVPDGQTQAHGEYRGCIASRGKNEKSAPTVVWCGHRITYKLCLTTWKTLYTSQPLYLS